MPPAPNPVATVLPTVPPTQPAYSTGANLPALPRKSAALGLIAMIAALVLGFVSAVAAVVYGTQADALHPTDSEAIGLVGAWLVGTAIGVPVLVAGILAIVLRRGRVFGIIAVSFAVAAPGVANFLLGFMSGFLQGV
ncbi:hypothetical protein BH09ACT1_BH09ACT1_29690 [soil metagenome]